MHNQPQDTTCHVNNAWLLKTTQRFIPLYLAVDRHGRVKWVDAPSNALRFESEHHAYQHITTEMKHHGIIAAQVPAWD